MNIQETEDRIVGIQANQMMVDLKPYFTHQNRRLSQLALQRILVDLMKGEFLEQRKMGLEVHEAYDETMLTIDRFSTQMKQAIKDFTGHHNG